MIKGLASDRNIMPNILSLFTGIGGLDIGFHEAGFNIVSCVEIEKVFCDTLRVNCDRISSASIHEMDINDYVKTSYLWPENIDFIVGGPPCQPFSACLLYTSPSPRDRQKSRMPSSA